MPEPTLEDALANIYGFYAARARGTPGARVLEEEGLLLIDSGLPNSELNIAFVTGPVADTGRAVRRARDVVGAHHPWRFESPIEESDRFSGPLAEIGLTRAEVRPALLLRPPELQEAPIPDGLEVTPVRTPEERRRFFETLVRGMSGGSLPPGVPWERLRLDGGTSFLGYRHGVPVATAQIFRHRRVVGLYAVATVAEARRGGIGRALSAWAVREGFRQGAELAVLQSTTMGLHVYQAIGFRPAFDHQVWRSVDRAGPPT